MFFVIRMWLVVLLSLVSLTSSWGREQPGPSADLLANPTYSGGIGLIYSCITNYYVNANIGNDANNGLSPSSAFATIQHADTVGGPGVCVNVAPGTYTFPTRFTPIHGGNSATPTGYMVYRCQILDQCFTVFTEATFPPFYDRMWAVSVSYFIIDGFDIDGGESIFGGRANVCVSSNSSDNPPPGHHIWVLNNNIHGCNLSGIQFGNSEFMFVIHNNIYNNSWTNQFQGSGYSIVTPTYLGAPDSVFPPYTPTVYDQAFAPFHIIVSWNNVYHNGCATCTGEIQNYSTTANTNGTTTLGNIANVGTSASFTASFAADPNSCNCLSDMTVTGIMGTINIGDLLFFTMNTAPVAGQPSFLGTSVILFGTGTGGNGTYVVNFPYQSLVTGSISVTSATLGKGVYVQGPGISPFTYIGSISGNTATLTRPATTTQTGGTFTFRTPEFTNHTDGNGIILDTYCSATTCSGGGQQTNYDFPDKQTLVSFNNVQFNGGRGVHAFATFYVTAANNSTYHNGLDLYQNGFMPELSNGGVNNSWINNIGSAVESILTPCSFNFNFPTCNFSLGSGDARGVMNANNVFDKNDTIGGAGLGFFSTSDFNAYNAGGNIISDPLYIDGTSSIMGNLQLQVGSPVINFAVPRAFPFLPKQTTDAGAWQTGGLRTIFNTGSIPDFAGEIGFQEIPIIPVPLSCPQATAWLARISGYDRVHHDAYSNLICGLVNAGYWCDTTLDILYIFATYSESAARLNLCSDTNYTPVFNGSPVFTADKGYAGVNSSNTVYVDTQFNPFTAVTPFYTLNDAHLSVWSNNDVLATSPAFAIGACCTNSGTSDMSLRISSAPGQANYEVNVNNDTANFTHTFNQPTSLGQFLAARINGTTVNGYFDSALQFTYSEPSFPVTRNLYVLASDIQGTAFGGPWQLGAATVGNSRVNSDPKTFCHLFRVYMTTLGNTGGTC